MAILSGHRSPRLPRLLAPTLSALLLRVVLAGGSALAQSDVSGPLEYQVKAAYLLNFTRYIEWPEAAFAGSGTPIRICVLGQDPFGSILDQTVADQRTQGRQVMSYHLARSGQVAAQGCHVLYIGRDIRRAASWRDPVLGRPVVTVGEGEDFLEEGGMIGFVLSDETVRFAVSLPATHAAGLAISSRVLNLATRVVPDRPGP